MKEEAKRKIYESELSAWKARAIGTECYYKQERNCNGHYIKMTAPNRFECDRCGTGLMFPTFNEMKMSRRRGAEYRVKDIESRLSIKREEQNKLNLQIRVLKVELKLAKQKLKRWR